MTKAEVVEKMAKGAGISKGAAGKALDSFIGGLLKLSRKGTRLLLLALELSRFLKGKPGQAETLRRVNQYKFLPERFLSFQQGRLLRML